MNMLLPSDRMPDEATPMLDRVVALIYSAKADGLPFNCVRMAPLDLLLLSAEKDWGKFAAPSDGDKLYWSLKDGWRINGVPIQVDTSCVPGQLWIGEEQRNFQRSN